MSELGFTYKSGENFDREITGMAAPPDMTISIKGLRLFVSGKIDYAFFAEFSRFAITYCLVKLPAWFGFINMGSALGLFPLRAPRDFPAWRIA